ncbi:MAG: sugar phosphate nucleotidyltransferase, partial [Dehalococcoidales bacterium]|nr:sugar phosphate nucleotidyltransferase [Dehalococcoidales bacterium]
MDAVILVGGKGTRLQTVVNDRPKPMAEVQGRPFVERILSTLKAQGIHRVVLAVGHQADVVISHFTQNPYPGMELIFSREATPLGTAGALRNALPAIRSPLLLVLNGDSYCRFSVDDLFNRHRHCGALATLWLTETDDCRRYGSVEVDADGRVTS